MRYAVVAKNRGDAVAHVKWVMQHHKIDRQLDVWVLGLNTPHDVEKIRAVGRGNLSAYMCVAQDFDDGEYSVDMIEMLRFQDADLRWFPPDECQPM